LRGIDLAFDYSQETQVTGTLPDGGLNTVAARVVRIEAFVAMKGIAIAERKKPKDAYDVYFCLKHFPGGTKALAGALQPILGNKLIQEGLQGLGQKFQTIDHVGPD
jgi:hypothetical protein